MTIREYLCREARRITDRALSDFTDAETWRRLLPEKRAQYMAMMGLEDLPPREDRPPTNPMVTGVLERDGYRVEKLYYEALPKLYVAANLYVPANLDRPAPAVLYVCGHSQTQKAWYQAHPRRFAQLGFVALVVDTVQLGEVRGHHHGCYSQGWFHWYSRGYTPAGTELLNGIRGLDLLQERPEVDGRKLGVTGISGGGAVSWWMAAGDERIGVAAPVCGTASLASQIADRTVDGHCDCMWFINSYLWDLADVGGLIAPRPLLIASGDQDPIFNLDSVRLVHDQLAGLYDKLGVPDHLALVETPGPHAYAEKSRTAIFSWFLRHLMGMEVPPEQVGDLDDSEQAQETEDALRVFVRGPLPEDRTPVIHEQLLLPAEPPRVRDEQDLRIERERVVASLRDHTFRAFPTDPPPLEPEVTQRLDFNGSLGLSFAYTSEEGLRLRGTLRIGGDVETPAPAVVVLRQRGESRGASDAFAGRIPAPWAKVVLDPRGTGDTAWGDELCWHVRRAAAWTGRTVASMQVWDVLRGLQAVRSLEWVREDHVAVAAREDMAAVALYAALLDGHVRTLLLDSPAPTQNAGSRPDGTGPAVEMLSCLKFADLPQVAGLLWPTEIVVTGQFPVGYLWARDLYERLGEPGRLRVLPDLGLWRAE